MSPEELAEVMHLYQANANASYQSNLELLGVINLEKPSSIQLYPSNFEAKDDLAALIDDHNTTQAAGGTSGNIITYSDLIETMMNSVISIINIISYNVIAFVAFAYVFCSSFIII